jgi:Protein of unknown function (DUF1116)
LRPSSPCSVAWRYSPEVGAECPNWARSDLCGGRSAMSGPTAICGEIFVNLVFPLRMQDLAAASYGNRAYCTINEGLGKVIRFGGNDLWPALVLLHLYRGIRMPNQKIIASHRCTIKLRHVSL